MQETQDTHRVPQPVIKKKKVAVIDDDPVVREGLPRIIDETPEGDLECVGCFEEYTSALLNRFRDLQVEVIILDVRLKYGQNSSVGLEVSRAIRREFAGGIKILLFTAYDEYKRMVDSAMADGFLLKGAPNDQIRQAIRNPPPPPGIGMITGLELHPSNYEVIVIGTDGRQLFNTQRSQEIPPTPFAFLHYLAEERRRDAQGWVVRKGAGYSFQAGAVWKAICRQAGSEWENRTEIEPSRISRWASDVDKPIKPWLRPGMVPLIGRPREGKYVKYVLNEGIASQKIIIH